jgi:hypothetical protein
MRLFDAPLPVLLLGWASLAAGNRDGVFRRQSYDRSQRQGPNTEQRELQRVAQFCTPNPTPFNTSVYVTLIGDGGSFQDNDLNTLLRMLLTSFNELNTQSCDTTFRTLNAVKVGDVYYSDEMEWERLRFDVSGVCQGCLPQELDSGTGPLFGGAEFLTPVVRRELEEVDNTTVSLTSRQVRGLKGRSGKRRLLNKDGKGKAGGKTGEDVISTAATSDPQAIQAVSGVIITPGPPITPGPTPSPTPSPTVALPVQEALPGPCGCSAVLPLFRGPTPSEFGVLLNTMISEARSTGTLSGVSFLEDLFEASVAQESTVAASASARQVASCATEDNKDFTTTVWLEVTPTSPSIVELPVAERLPLEVAVLESFNEMILLSCDTPFYRIVSSVKYGETRQSGDKLQFRFDVGGRCVNCDSSTMLLFGDLVIDTSVISTGRSSSSVLNVTGFRGASRSLLVSEVQRITEALSQPIPIIRQVHTTCTCPLNINNLPLRPPTVAEFGEVLNSAVADLTETGYLSSILQVVRVAEPEIDSVCPADVVTFTSSIFADFQGRPDLLEDSEVATLEAGFRDTYNQLIFNSCDEYFRTIADVRLLPGVTRRRLQFTSVNNSTVPDLRSEAPSVYMITGQCRGCPITSSGSFSLIDDAFRFRKLMGGDIPTKDTAVVPHYHYGSLEEATQSFMKIESGHTSPRASSVGETQRRLQECACAPGATADAPYAPGAEEFRTSYNAEITKYNQNGLVVNVQEVTKLVEYPPGLLSVVFSIYYGTLERVGNWTQRDIPPLVATTEKFYRTYLTQEYKAQGIGLLAVNVFWNSSIPRADLDLLQVVFTAELVFEDLPNIPTADEVTVVMEELDYVHYITSYVWELAITESVFRRTHTVRFVGRQNMLRDLSLQFTVRSDRADGGGPTPEDRQGLADQVNRFYFDVLRSANLDVTSVYSYIDAEDVALIQSGTLTVDFDLNVEFSRVQDTLHEEEIGRILESADLEVLRRDYLGAVAPVGSGVFNDAFDIAIVAP